ncbi:class I SAM-dependent methyltransferase [Acinetobacter puyangensis]|uniref:class I SAM-dependent methyltransferase n=1 Tax=Acinetobacter puyangensis TaxID=1096779 RepID=UPI003A4E5DD4
MQDLNFLLYAAPEHENCALAWQKQLSDLNVHTQIEWVDEINARFLRFHPELSLIVDENGLWLAANGMKMQPAWQAEMPRLKRANPKNELLARACQVNRVETILDATAGLGHDGLLLAWLGAKVTLLERHPVLFALLLSTLEQAKLDPGLADTAQRIKLLHTDAEHYLADITSEQYDVIYLDPMFPSRDANQKQEKKQAQVKKQMQLLHMLLPVDGVMDLGENLLSQARLKSSRVIVKRPKHAVFLADQMPQHQWHGDACRFDGYFKI